MKSNSYLPLYFYNIYSANSLYLHIPSYFMAYESISNNSGSSLEDVLLSSNPLLFYYLISSFYYCYVDSELDSSEFHYFVTYYYCSYYT